MSDKHGRRTHQTLYDRYGHIHFALFFIAIGIVALGYIMQYTGHYDHLPYWLKGVLAVVIVVSLVISWFFGRKWRRYT